MICGNSLLTIIASVVKSYKDVFSILFKKKVLFAVSDQHKVFHQTLNDCYLISWLIVLLLSVVAVASAVLDHGVLLDPRIILQIPSRPLDRHSVLSHLVEQLLLIDRGLDRRLGVDGLPEEGTLLVGVDVAELVALDATDVSNLELK